MDTDPLRRWLSDLIGAVNFDNQFPNIHCIATRTYKTLKVAPAAVRDHANLAVADFERIGGMMPFAALRSDTVASAFQVTTELSAVNLLVGRMTVPGGPWPGHYGLEAVAFTARPCRMPDWFPTLKAFMQSLFFAQFVIGSDAYLKGQASILFPELLSLETPAERQSFGIVFLDRLVSLYATKVLPALSRISLRKEPAGLPYSPEHRELAFLAHEWGHLSGPVPYQLTTGARRTRSLAVISEIHADLAAMDMLVSHGTEASLEIANVLTLDRIIREAWLPRASSQVDSVAARQLLLILSITGGLRHTASGFGLSLSECAGKLAEELAIVREIESSSGKGQLEAAASYLAGYGWMVRSSRYSVNSADEVSIALMRSLADSGSPDAIPSRLHCHQEVSGKLLDSYGCLARDLELSSQVLLAARQGFAYVPSGLDPDFLAEIQREAAAGEYIPSGLDPGAIGDGSIFELFHPFGDYPAVLALATELSRVARSVCELPALADFFPDRATFLRYGPDDTGIRPHRDRLSDVLLVMNVTLKGRGIFRIHMDDQTELPLNVRAADMVILRARGLGDPTAESRLRHSVDQRESPGRLSLTYRTKTH